AGSITDRVRVPRHSSGRTAAAHSFATAAAPAHPRRSRAGAGLGARAAGPRRRTWAQHLAATAGKSAGSAGGSHDAAIEPGRAGLPPAGPGRRLSLPARGAGAMKTKATIYGIKNCDTMKKARAWLDANGVAYDFHDYKTAGVERPRLEGWAAKVGWEVLL